MKSVQGSKTENLTEKKGELSYDRVQESRAKRMGRLY